MKRIIRIIILIAIVSGLIYSSGGISNLFHPSTVRAFGDLAVDFHVLPGNPIFTITNMAPGDNVSRTVDVTNGGTVAHLVALRGVRTNGTGLSPKLESILSIVITDGITPLYGTGSLTGPKTLAQFFTDSTSTNGIPLGNILPSGHKTYTLKVTFPTSAGNEFQAKSVIFDLTFGEITGDNLVINEVYYKVDGSHGLDSPKDRGILGVNGNKVTIVINGNGAGSKNKVTVDINTACTILQANINSTTTIINSNASTGNNSANNNTGGSGNVTSGSAKSTGKVINTGSTNSAFGCGNKLGQDDEWVELFNPTDHDVSLKDWTLTDNSGTPTIIHPNKIIKAGGFALLAKSASTFTNWTIPPGTLIVELGQVIGDGLDNSGDHLILKDPSSLEVDKMSWGTDTTGFTPPAINPIVPLGDSTARVVPGFDTNTVGDWMDSHPPTPGH